MGCARFACSNFFYLPNSVRAPTAKRGAFLTECKCKLEPNWHRHVASATCVTSCVTNLRTINGRQCAGRVEQLNGDTPSLPPTPARDRIRKTETRDRSVSHFICYAMSGPSEATYLFILQLQCDEWNKQTICTRRRGPSFFESPLVPGGNPDYPMLLIPSGVVCLAFSPFTRVKLTPPTCGAAGTVQG